MPEIKCQYCSSSASLRNSSIVYQGRDFGLLYICNNYPVCDSYVGVHRNTIKPKGSLANKDLREIRKKAHFYFDYLWNKKMKIHNCKKRTARTKAYEWLSKQINIPFDECHIGMFDIENCEKVIKLCKPFYRGMIQP